MFSALNQFWPQFWFKKKKCINWIEYISQTRNWVSVICGKEFDDILMQNPLNLSSNWFLKINIITFIHFSYISRFVHWIIFRTIGTCLQNVSSIEFVICDKITSKVAATCFWNIPIAFTATSPSLVILLISPNPWLESLWVLVCNSIKTIGMFLESFNKIQQFNCKKLICQVRWNVLLKHAYSSLLKHVCNKNNNKNSYAFHIT